MEADLQARAFERSRRCRQRKGEVGEDASAHRHHKSQARRARRARVVSSGWNTYIQHEQAPPPATARLPHPPRRCQRHRRVVVTTTTTTTTPRPAPPRPSHHRGERREGIVVANPLVECVFERLFRTTARDEKGLPLRTRWSNAFRTFVPYREEREQLIEPLDVAAHARRRRRDLRRAVRVDDRRDDARQSARRRGEAGGGGRTRARSDTSPCPAKESDPSLGQLSGSRVALPGASPSPPAANRGRVSHWNREAQRQEIPGTR